ncbi:primosomal protein N' [Rhodovulum sp. DZ06]|uniref:primosomal protein N' n=1 Tax=Rhodovulum sp. DZ06 TaxID=3425126 RepID=UPI003D340BEA
MTRSDAPAPRPEEDGPRRFAPWDAVAVLAPLPLDGPLDYLAPEGGVTEGALVEIPLGPRTAIGVVWGPGSGEVPRARLKPIKSVIDLPPMRPQMRAFLDRAADYTLTDRGLMLRLATRAKGLADPPGVRTLYAPSGAPPAKITEARQRVLDALARFGGMPMAPGELAKEAGVSVGVVKGLADAGGLKAVEAPRDLPYPRLSPSAPGKPLSAAQAAAAAELAESVSARKFSATLLRGVTGSGKTEVYLEAVAACLAARRQALILLPEIALTSDFLDRFAARFGARPALWHSQATDAERRRAWKAVAKGEAQAVAGARSALFLPFQDLGLVVVDEEHDTAYKQEEGALYNARDLAVLRASHEGAAALLASATPSLETWANAQAGKYRRLDLPERFGPAVPPALKPLDLRKDGPAKGQWIAPPLAEGVLQRLEKGEQSLLFLNRRGYAPVTRCTGCGHQMGCPHCDATLVEHRFRGRLMCHQCGWEQSAPKACPGCGAADKMAPIGPGVERLAEEAQARFPDARVAILSSDLTSARTLAEQIAAIARGEADVIIGTQLAAKGHNFPMLTLVGVIDADLALRGGDLRAAERTFQLVRQVAGRAGRAERPGEALIQTCAPEHPVIRAILDGDEEAFLREEAERRMQAGAPPYGRMAGVIVSGPDEGRAARTAEALARAGEGLGRSGVQLFGPAPAPISRIRGKYRFRLLAKAPRSAPLQKALRAWRDSVKPEPGVTVKIDIDPQSFL